MSKETTKKKNPILDDEDTSKDEETTDENVSDESTEEETAPKKVTPKSAPAEVKVEAPRVNAAQALNSDIALTKKKLASRPTVQFFAPLGMGEKPGATETVWINGYPTVVRKGVMTQVPDLVANILAEHYQINSEAGSEFRTDLNAEKENALS